MAFGHIATLQCVVGWPTCTDEGTQPWPPVPFQDNSEDRTDPPTPAQSHLSHAAPLILSLFLNSLAFVPENSPANFLHTNLAQSVSGEAKPR
jgi:hypothetical protein